ncbi:MAG: M14 family metallopeptidase [Pseudomonadota bacterium]|nr:M14 family metallopeptidase [Pseudomonadota bacterium]
MSGTPHYADCFRETWIEARNAFCAAGARAGGALFRDTHPWAVGPAGEPLSIDLCRIGRADAPRALVVISGAHGLEGAAGSAAQIAWLKSGHAATLPEDVAVYFVHALNPFGFAHGTRTTENNVDLNRNFLDFDAQLPGNDPFKGLADALLPPRWDMGAIEAFRAAFDAFAQQHGESALFDALARGQYSHPEHPTFGGHAPEWSNLTLRRLLHTHLAQAEMVGFIDWHTGLGDYGDTFFLCFNPPGGPLEAEAARWWGGERIFDQSPAGLSRPSYTGLVFYGAEEALPGRPFVGAVVEFGTRGPDVREALILDTWLRFSGEPDPARRAVLEAHLRDVFVPASGTWRQGAVAHALEITQSAIDGIATWTPETTRTH